jgi:hypothetical protein
MTIASIAMPRWISFVPVRLVAPSNAYNSTPTNDTQDGERKLSYGLHSMCVDKGGRGQTVCEPFPRERDCKRDPSFCNMWRTVGFLISFAVVTELCTLVSFVVIVGGGVQRRAAGWQVASGVLVFAAVVQCAGMAIVVCLTRLAHSNLRAQD